MITENSAKSFSDRTMEHYMNKHQRQNRDPDEIEFEKNQKQFTFKPSIGTSKPQYSPNRIEKYIKSDNGPEPVLMSRFHGQRNPNSARQNTLQDNAAPFRYEQKNKTNGKKPNQPQQTKPSGEGHDQSSPRSVDSMDQPTDTNYNY